MAGGCKAAIGCVDARVPVRASYVSLYKWPESDAEFVRSVAMARRHHHHPPDQSPAASSMSPRVVDSYSCRQMYLRSYTFSTRKETVPERTMACLGRVRTSVFPNRGGSDAGSSVGGSARGFAAAGGVQCSSSAAARDEDDDDGGSGTRRKRRRRRRKKKKKQGPCAVVRRLQEASRAVFRRLLACTATVDVAEPPPSR